MIFSHFSNTCAFFKLLRISEAPNRKEKNFQSIDNQKMKSARNLTLFPIEYRKIVLTKTKWNQNFIISSRNVYNMFYFLEEIYYRNKVRYPATKFCASGAKIKRKLEILRKCWEFYSGNSIEKSTFLLRFFTFYPENLE